MKTTTATGQTAKNEILLYGVKKGQPDYMEDLIATSHQCNLSAARAWAIANGFDRLREATFTPGEMPDFIKAINHP